jgi:hypothetical protein
LRITSNISSMFVSSRKEISVTVHFVLVKRNTDINHLGEEKWHGSMAHINRATVFPPSIPRLLVLAAVASSQ